MAPDIDAATQLLKDGKVCTVSTQHSLTSTCYIITGLGVEGCEAVCG